MDTEIVPAQAAQPALPLERFASDFLMNQRSENTQSTYRRSLDRYFAWCQENGIAPAYVSMSQAIQYRTDIEENYAESSGALHISAVKAFYTMLHSIGVLPLNVWGAVKGIHAPTVSPTVALDHRELKAIYAKAEQHSRRDLLVVRLLYEVPLRREEVCALRKDALRTGTEGWVLRVKGKGNRTEDVGITDDLAHAITAQAVLAEGEWVFPAGRGGSGHLDKRQINRIADRYGFHPHQLRHSFATNAIAQGIELPDISRTMRHQNYNTTMRYFNVRERVRRSASRRLTPVLEPQE